MSVRRLQSLLLENDKGALLPTFAILLPVLLVLLGGGIDFSRQRHAIQDLQRAADSAVLAAAAAYENGQDGKEAVRNVAERYFQTNSEHTHFVELPDYDVKIIGKEIVLTADGEIDTYFLKFIGIPRLEARIEAGSRIAGSYLDLHVYVDATGSMNIPDAASDIPRFAALFRPYGGTENCSFACHIPGDPSPSGQPGTFNGKTGYQIARENNIYLREDRVRDSLADMIDAVSRSDASANIKMSISTFGWTTKEEAPLSNRFQELMDAARSIENTSRGTSISYLLGLLEQSMDGGTGTKGDPDQAILLITDGIEQDMITYGSGSLDVQKCEALKAKGVDILILHIAYPDPDSLQGNDTKVDQFRPQISNAGSKLEACASPGKVFSAIGGEGIADAMEEIGSSLSGAAAVHLTR